MSLSLHPTWFLMLKVQSVQPGLNFKGVNFATNSGISAKNLEIKWLEIEITTFASSQRLMPSMYPAIVDPSKINVFVLWLHQAISLLNLKRFRDHP